MNTRCSKKKYVVYSIPYTLLYNMYQLKQLYREHDRFVTRQFHSIHPDQGLKAPAVQVQLDSGFGGSGAGGKGSKVAILKGWNGFFWKRSQVKKTKEFGTWNFQNVLWSLVTILGVSFKNSFPFCMLPYPFFSTSGGEIPCSFKKHPEKSGFEISCVYQLQHFPLPLVFPIFSENSL